MRTSPIHSAYRRVRWWLSSFSARLQRRQVVHLLHIGKTGGSALKSVLRRFPVGSAWHVRLHPHRTRLHDLPHGDRVVFCVRDPTSRFVSSFYSRQRQGRPRINSPWTPQEAEAFAFFQTPNQLACALEAPDTALRERAHRAMRAIEHVRTSYWDWFDDEAYLRARAGCLLGMFSQEHLAEGFELLKAKLALPADAALPSDDVTAHRNPADVDRALSPEAEGNLRRWYSEDYRFIDICEELRARPGLLSTELRS